MAQPEIRIVANQIGAFIELHGHADEPIVLGKLHTERIREYQEFLMDRNPNMRYASFRQVVMGCAQVWFDTVKANCPETLTLSPHLWIYNASSRTYKTA